MLHILGFFIYCVAASPIPAQSSTHAHAHAHASSLIFIIVAVLVALAFLSITKCLYVRHRRKIVSGSSSSQYHSRSYYAPFSIESYCRSSSGTLPTAVAAVNKEDLSLSLTSTTTTASNGHFTGSGFFVGFLGSPAWETSFSFQAGSCPALNLPNPVYNWNQQSNSDALSMSIYQTQAIDQAGQPSSALLKSKSPKYRYKSASLPSVVNKNIDDAHVSIRRRSLSKSWSLNYKLPKHPESVHYPSRPRPRHRHSLPSSVRARQHSAPSMVSAGESNTEKKSGPSNGRSRSISACRQKSTGITDTSLRLVDPIIDVSEVPLPLSPAFSTSNIKSKPSHILKPKIKRIPAPPEPLAVHSRSSTPDPFSSAANASSTIIPPPSPRSVEISHPFPLAYLPQIMSGAKSQAANTKQGRSRDSELYQELLPVLKPLDVNASPAELNRQNRNQSTIRDFKFLSQARPVPDTSETLEPDTPRNTNFISAPARLINNNSNNSIQTSSPLKSVPITPISRNAAAVVSQPLLVNPKPQRAFRATDGHSKARNSVVFGPSPLRMMILPDASSSSESDIRSSHASSLARNESRNGGGQSDKNKKNDKENSCPTVGGTRVNELIRKSFWSGSGSGSFNSRSSGPGEFGEFSWKNEIYDGNGGASDDESIRASMNAGKASSVLLDLLQEQERGSVGRIENSAVDEIDLGLTRFTSAHGDSGGPLDIDQIDFVSFWEEARLLESDSDVIMRCVALP